MTSVRAAQPSYVVLPRDITDKSTVLSFLISHFDRIAAEVWHQRVADGKVHWQDGSLIDASTLYRPTARVYYYREVVAETKIPFTEQILYQDDEILLVYKPHFLPVTPSGNYVNECLVHRLRLRTGIEKLTPAHRLDRETAGVMLFSVNPATRHHYHDLFKSKHITKQYQALARLTPALADAARHGSLTLPLRWTVKNRMKPAVPSFLMQIVEGEANTHSEIALLAVSGDMGLFQLSPITGKTHQLRVHMQSLGMPLWNDRFYPELQPKAADDFSRPLQLLAYRLCFTDPVTGKAHDWQVDGLSLPQAD
ncbi:RNA pseudouridylate synthase [Shewanella sp. NFH-SH190041]|uniref:pseudouridine synthase n=1 Tax=Shewanella sp. NFH-SH190041 TaxID=2950245 RepID=UPI0021C4A28F|nr:pseudouridine synthase [Shewanella sp. NFH-SH190041]BDM63015.1 RNA pseudouridylate synthase [Shewanella sp. NFH-SH190041]